MNINIESVIQRVTDTLKTETVIGERIAIGEITLIPVMNVMFGFGVGGGEGKQGVGDQGAGTGGGGGGRMTVVGMMVVKGDEVSFISTTKGAGKSGSIDKILDALPDLIDKVSSKTSKSKDEPDVD